MKCSEKAWYQFVAFVALALLTRITYAHPFWIQPADFRPATGAQVPLRLMVGIDFKGEPLVYAPERFNRYIYVGPDGEQDVTGTLGDDPAGNLFVKKAGFYTVGYYSKSSEITFDNFPKFQEYLEYEGLERNHDVAEKRFKIRKGILELYQRCAKSLVKVGNATGPVDRVLGFPIELVAETDPYDTGNENLRVRLLYNGKPLEHALVLAFNKKDRHNPQRVRTDKDGHATIKLDQPGPWMLNAVHMIPSGILSRADWHSFWASLTFERP